MASRAAPALTEEKPEMVVELKTMVRVGKDAFRLETVPVTVDVVTVGRIILRTVSAETVTGVESV